MWFSGENQAVHRTRWLLLSVILGTVFSSALWGQVTVNVVGSDGNTGIPYRWLVEQDTTYPVEPGVVDRNPPVLRFHKSSFPVVSKGESAPTGGPVTLTLPAGSKYFVSVLPKEPGTYSMSGAAIPATPRPTSVTITLNKLPLPTAQVSVFVFEDTKPLNNAPDVNERGLGGFSVLLEDAGGRYGAAAGQQTQDAFGNPLGTTYQTCTAPSATCVNGYVLDAEGSPVVVSQGTGVLKTDANGRLSVKNLAPGKYGITIVPPAGQGWQQVTTIEGTRLIDAWVAANEPPFFKEFGPATFHTFFGFVRPFNNLGALPASGPRITINGRVVELRIGRPPNPGFFSGSPLEYTTPWIGLNDTTAGNALYAAAGNSDGTFSIPSVPPGTYQLVVWDANMDVIINFSTVTVAADGTCNGGPGCNIGDVPVNPWFARHRHFVFHDDGCAGQPGVSATQTAAWAENGYREPCEKGLLEQNVNLRWRDGTINQLAPTDLSGEVPFDELFPFFAWQVAEVDYKSMKATGVTVTVDNGGAVNQSLYRSFEGQTDPQRQFCTAVDVINEANAACFGKAVGVAAINPFSAVEPGGPNNFSRTERGPVLTQAYQSFIGQTTVFEWGKAAYKPGENGGITGVVYYKVARSEDSPEESIQMPFEPGIPDVTVRLLDWTGTQLLAEVQTDSWDRSAPAGCQGDKYVYKWGPNANDVTATDCFDGWRSYSQVRNGVFDGGYAITQCLVDGTGQCVPQGTSGATLQPLPAGEYIVQVVPPAGYEVVKAQDKNVDFGDSYVPAPDLMPPACVGTPYVVPNELALFPGVQPNNAGDTLNLCDKKQVFLNPGQNAAADFFLFTEVPLSARITGTITDDLNNTPNASSPQWGEKFAPSWLPVAIRDWTGREVVRVYSDQFGRYNLLVPSTYTANLPQPSGISPSMLQACINARMKPDGTTDPNFRPNYKEACYVFQFMPGVTTYLDTPTFPIAAMAGRNELPVDCEQRDGTPRIHHVTAPQNGKGGGPWVPSTGTDAQRTVEIYSLGATTVRNPDYCPGAPGSADCNPINMNTTVVRDYGFGSTQGKVFLGNQALPIVSWTDALIKVTVPSGSATNRVVVERGDNLRRSVVGVTLTMGPATQTVRTVNPLSPGQSCGGTVSCPIQAAIDAANPGDLILVAPGIYMEMVIMYKPVQLQGWGEGTTIDALSYPGSKLADWRKKADQIVASGVVQLLPGQVTPQNQPLGVGPLNNEEGAGILVLGCRPGHPQCGSTAPGLFTKARAARIDGFSITGAEGAGIVVNGYAPWLTISNNRIFSNYGIFGGGVRIGHPQLINPATGSYTDSQNDGITVRNNHIQLNGGTIGAGGGLAICTGADGYQVTENFVCGNFMASDGGGIAHLGTIPNGVIANNRVMFNESFYGGTTVSGGGIFIAGLPPLAPATLSSGAGTVRVLGNLVQGNSAGAGDGGGIAVARFNGTDVAANPTNPSLHYRLDLFNNIVVNNVAGVAGGGISLSDAVNSRILHNTVVNNDSTATAFQAFPAGWGVCPPTGSCLQTTIPQPAGIVARAHSNALQAAGNFAVNHANPDLRNNIIWHNRSFRFASDSTANPPLHLMLPDLATPGTQPDYWDLGVLGAAASAQLNPQYCLLTSTTGFNATNVTGNPAFVAQYLNGGGNGTSPAQDPLVAFDEGGNAIRVRYAPVTETLYNAAGIDTLRGDYHIGSLSVALNRALQIALGDLAKDYDGQPRPVPAATPDIGADERQ